MKKLRPIAYRALFFKHLWRFLRNVATPGELNCPVAVAVSGGRDSMTLLWVAHYLHQKGLIGPVRAIFVHHHTRHGQSGDAKLVEDVCRQEGIPCTILHGEGLTPFMSNFENRARQLRRDLCLENLRPGEKLWVGHHLDDSYEWNFMQRHRSYNPKASLGIPVRNGPIIRPFSCVSRNQIKRLARFEGITYREDPTNRDNRFDRNFLRNEVIPLLKKRYPKYLKFYSHFANFSAMTLNISVLNRGARSQIYVFEEGAVILGRRFSEIQIQELIHHYSNTDRGEIITPIERMLKAIDNDKKGPFHFSGGMEAYYSHHLLMVYRQGVKNYDASIAEALRLLTDEQLSAMPHYRQAELEQSWNNLLQTPDALLNMPGLVLVLESESIRKTLNTSVFDPLFPEVSQVCSERGLRFMTYQKCLDVWKNKKEKLPETLKLLPLNNLSNLFASQAT